MESIATLFVEGSH